MKCALCNGAMGSVCTSPGARYWARPTQRTTSLMWGTDPGTVDSYMSAICLAICMQTATSRGEDKAFDAHKLSSCHQSSTSSCEHQDNMVSSRLAVQLFLPEVRLLRLLNKGQSHRNAVPATTVIAFKTEPTLASMQAKAYLWQTFHTSSGFKALSAAEIGAKYIIQYCC